MSNVAITVKDMTIAYGKIKKLSIKNTLTGKKHNKKKSEKHAIQNISFEVEKGQIVGIIGRNGSGKSTLLRSIAGVFSPNVGSIDLHGNSVSLLSLGVGFNRKLTGLVNIYLSGLLLGFSQEEIAAKEKEIIEFADIGEAINQPVRSYSSGMYSKLAFAITSTLETDITLIDEVLSVGDEKFRRKSYARMQELISSDKRTVMIVSHNLSTIQSLCDKVIWLHNGSIKKIGEPKSVIVEYRQFMYE